MKQTIWCDACERNEPVDEQSAGLWLVMWCNGSRSLSVFRAEGVSTLTGTSSRVKRVCGEQGISKLISRWCSTGSLDAPRNAAADPPKGNACR
jgi:hypothetical protein